MTRVSGCSGAPFSISSAGWQKSVRSRIPCVMRVREIRLDALLRTVPHWHTLDHCNSQCLTSALSRDALTKVHSTPFVVCLIKGINLFLVNGNIGFDEQSLFAQACRKCRPSVTVEINDCDIPPRLDQAIHNCKANSGCCRTCMSV